MSEIPQQLTPIPPHVQIDNDLKVWLEENMGQIQQEVWKLRQFLQAAIKLNEGAPNQEFEP